MLTRQRSTVDYSHNFVIADDEVERYESRRNRPYEGKYQWTVEQVLEGFDPKENDWDRRLLYEVTGIQLNPGEYNEISDDEDDNVKFGKAFVSVNADQLFQQVTKDIERSPRQRQPTRPWSHTLIMD